MNLVFKGVVTCGDAYRCDDVDEPGAVLIGGEDVVAVINNAFDNVPVIVGIADHTFTGELFVETGWGYSEWTPMDSDALRVGDHDLIEILRRYEHGEITLIISTEPVNILEAVEGASE
ncbi:hypothetical protein [Paenibacillus polymyxa]|uniref:hypothetical protein n=1 Tax=Paenibacillus polymyxa TaxID=1406 RepID=UPI0006BF7400|nr:hypothetical protein [Paenibacillus polymyxa]KOS03134.1 hypothetical protein AM598_08435 [Paenibacillus polymyxa]